MVLQQYGRYATAGTRRIWNYQQIDLGFNYRMTDIQAALGLSQMQRLDEFVAKRNIIANDMTICWPIFQ